jgi:Icc-related predicted phosphoesterase
VCIEDKIYMHQGLRILGLGGSMRYRPGAFQYTQQQMEWRVRKLALPLWRSRGFDILLTHAPALGINDGEDLPHQGFAAFRTLLDKYQPGFFVHGHVHMNYGQQHPRVSQYGGTQVINAYERYEFDAQVPGLPPTVHLFEV